MSNSLTQAGQACMLLGAATPNGGLANTAAFLRLFLNTSIPNKDPGSATWNEVPNGNGYAAIAITRSSWSQAVDVDGNQKLTLATQVITATGPINNVEGAYLTDSFGNVLAWFDRGSAVNLVAGDTITVTGLYVKIT